MEIPEPTESHQGDAPPAGSDDSTAKTVSLQPAAAAVAEADADATESSDGEV